MSSPLLALESGEDRFESFGINAGSDNYNIEVAAGAFIQVSMGVIEGDLEPEVFIFKPEDAVLAEGESNVLASGNETVRPGYILSATATVAGTYRVKTSSVNDKLGDYRITVVSAPGPLALSDENAALTSGQTVEGSIPIGDLDVFTIEAKAGAAIRVGIGSTDGTFDSRIQVIDPTGVSIGNRSVVNSGVQLRTNATVDGTYTIIVSERSGFGFGDYRLSAFVSDESIIDNSENGTLASGQRISGSLPLGDFDAFTFSANEGDVVRMAAGNLTSNFQAEIEIFGPNGFIDNTQSVTTSNTEFTAPATGTYTALISDDFGTQTSDYQVALVTLPTDEIVNDDGINRFLAPGNTIMQAMGRNDLHVYSFAGTNDDAVMIEFLRGPDESVLYSPRFELFGPDGTRLLGSVTGQHQLTLSATGDYYFVVLYPNNTRSGAYTLNITGQTGTSGVTFKPSPNGGDLDLTAVALSNGILEISYPASVTGLSLHRSETLLNDFVPQPTTVENGRHVFRVINPTDKAFFRLQELETEG